MSTSTNPMILSGDSLLFESSDMFNAIEPVSMNESRADGCKVHTIDELSSHLPVCHEVEAPKQTTSTSPFNIHSDVLDSVFSTTLEDNDQFQDHTPMFDELDFIIDGAKVNSKDDWVSLFGGESHDLPKDDCVVKDEDLDEVLFCEQGEQTDGTISMASSSSSPSFTESTVTLSTNTSSFSTPVIDQKFLKSKAKPSKVTKKRSIDHLGVTSFNKKTKIQDLPPIKLDNADPVAMKRAKNTEAARRSRARKMERMSQLEFKVEELLEDKSKLENEVIRLRELLSMNGIDY